MLPKVGLSLILLSQIITAVTASELENPLDTGPATQIAVHVKTVGLMAAGLVQVIQVDTRIKMFMHTMVNILCMIFI